MTLNVACGRICKTILRDATTLDEKVTKVCKSIGIMLRQETVKGKTKDSLSMTCIKAKENISFLTS